MPISVRVGTVQHCLLQVVLPISSQGLRPSAFASVRVGGDRDEGVRRRARTQTAMNVCLPCLRHAFATGSLLSRPEGSVRGSGGIGAGIAKDGEAVSQSGGARTVLAR